MCWQSLILIADKRTDAAQPTYSAENDPVQPMRGTGVVHVSGLLQLRAMLFSVAGRCGAWSQVTSTTTHTGSG